MYAFDHIRKAEDLTRLPGGEVQCGHSHYSGYSWSRRDDGRPAATDVWFDNSGSGSLVFSCRKHSGTIKGNRTQGHYMTRDVYDPRDYGVDVGEAAGNPEATIKRLRKAIADEKNEASRRSDIAMRIHLGRFWQQRRDEYAADDEVEFRPHEADDYGIYKVGIRFGTGYGGTEVRLTPAQVRKIIAFGDKWADAAEMLTNNAKPPVVTDEERAFMHIGDEPECDDCYRSDGTHNDEVEH